MPEYAGIYRPNNRPNRSMNRPACFYLLIHPTRGPPQTALAIGPIGPGSGEPEEVAQEPFPDDLDQSPEFDPAEPEPIPDEHFDQSWGA